MPVIKIKFMKDFENFKSGDVTCADRGDLRALKNAKILLPHDGKGKGDYSPRGTLMRISPEAEQQVAAFRELIQRHITTETEPTS